MSEFQFRISPFTLVLGLLLWVVAYDYLKKYVEKTYGYRKNNYIAAGVFGMLVLFFSVFMHELAHGLVAHLLGANVTGAGTMVLGAYVSIEDLAELDKFKVILISLAGPLTNLAIAWLLLIPVRRLSNTMGETVAQFGAWGNLNLFRWNMMPVAIGDFGLDGGRATQGVLTILVGEDVTSLLMWIFLGLVIVYAFRGRIFRRRFAVLEDRVNHL